MSLAFPQEYFSRISVEIHWNLADHSTEIPVKFHWNTSGIFLQDFRGVPLKFHWNFPGIFLWNFREILLEFQWNFSEIPVKFLWNICIYKYPLRKITSFSTASAQLSKLRRSFVKASGIGTCVFSCRNAAFTQSWRKAGFNAALTKSCRKAGFYAAFAKL